MILMEAMVITAVVIYIMTTWQMNMAVELAMLPQGFQSIYLAKVMDGNAPLTPVLPGGCVQPGNAPQDKGHVVHDLHHLSSVILEELPMEGMEIHMVMDIDS